MLAGDVLEGLRLGWRQHLHQLLLIQSTIPITRKLLLIHIPLRGHLRLQHHVIKIPPRKYTILPKQLTSLQRLHHRVQQTPPYPNKRHPRKVMLSVVDI